MSDGVLGVREELGMLETLEGLEVLETLEALTRQHRLGLSSVCESRVGSLRPHFRSLACSSPKWAG